MDRTFFCSVLSLRLCRKPDTWARYLSPTGARFSVVPRRHRSRHSLPGTGFPRGLPESGRRGVLEKLGEDSPSYTGHIRFHAASGEVGLLAQRLSVYLVSTQGCGETWMGILRGRGFARGGG